MASYQLVLGASALLLGLGLIMVLSASSIFARLNYGGNSFAIIERQLMFAVVGLVGAYVAAHIPLSTLRKLILPFLIVSVLLILATFIPGVGIEVNGNRNWLPLVGGFRLQPSEFAKLALVLWMADLYARRSKQLDTPRLVLTADGPGRRARRAARRLPARPRHGAGAVRPDHRHALGRRAARQADGRACSPACSSLLVFAVANSPRPRRPPAQLHQSRGRSRLPGFQSIHGMMALARGGFWGVGLGGSRQKWGSLPEAHTDFILAVIGEELGLLGTLVVLALFVFLAIAGIRIATRTRDPFVHFAAAGITIWIVVQAVINIGMVLGLLPVIGIPLPLISYGGSSLLVTLVAMGILINCAKTEPGAKRALAAGRANRGRARVLQRR